MKPFYLVFTFLLILSCSSDDSDGVVTIDPVDDFKIEKYHGLYAQYNNISTIADPTQDNLIKFEYDEQGRIIKRIGDVLHTSFGVLVISDLLYTDLTYYEDKVYIEKKITPTGGTSGVAQNEATITFDVNNRMIQKIRNYQISGGQDVQVDTTNFSYNNDKLVSYIKTSNKESTLWTGEVIGVRYFEESELYYSNSNLDSIVAISSRKYSDTPYIVLEDKETKIFSGYDSASNPFRKLQIFEETFNRSISQNNFTDYRVTRNGYHYPNNDFYQSPIVLPTYEESFQTWSFAYDENGEWIYDQF